jgi:tetratricopeptide (TPR) repeat protein
MNTCPSEADLRGWLEGATDAGTAAQVEACAPCQDVLERLTALDAGANAEAPTGTPTEPEDLGRLRCLLGDGVTATGRDGAAPDWPALPGFEILGELGRGGMGVVYKASQFSPHRLVAVKMIRAGEGATPEQVVRFGVEGEAVARLQHPNIVQLYEVGVHLQRPYFALEFVPGGSLEARLAGRPQPPHWAAGLVETLARALHHAHQKGVVHRDLKPANVLLTADGTPKVADFGMARLVHADLRLTRTGAVAGTPRYMAPEQTRPGQPVGPAADVYALGAILYEMLTGRPPFLAATPLEVLRQVAECDPVTPSRLAPMPRDLETVCLKCLRKEPGKRYTSAAALADDLRRFLDGKPVRARPVGPLGRGTRWCRRNPLLAGALAALAASVVVAFVWINHEKDAARTLAADNARLAGEERAARTQVQDALARQGAALKERDAAAREAVRAARRAEAVNNYLVRGMLADANPRRHGGRSPTVREVLDRAAADVAKAYAGQPELEEAVRATLGEAYWNAGQPAEALTQFTAWVALCRRLYGEEHLATLAARGYRASALASCGDYAAVVAESAVLLPLLRRVEGGGQPATLRLLEDTARARQGLGQVAEALRLQEGVVAARRRAHGPEHELTLTSLGLLATLLIDAGRAGEVRLLCEQQLPVCLRVLGPEHLTTLVLRNQHAGCLLMLGRLAEAQQECEEVLPLLRRTVGPGHPDTLLVTNNLACVLIKRRRPAEACRLFAECLPPLERQLGEGHPHVVKGFATYGLCLMALGRYPEMEALFEGLLRRQRRTLKPQDPALLASLAPYGLALTKQGKHAEAEPVWRELLEGRRKVLPAGHWRVGEAEARLGECLARLERYSEAETLLKAAHGRLAGAAGPPAPAAVVRRAVTELVALYEAWGKPEQAAAWRAKLAPGTP